MISTFDAGNHAVIDSRWRYIRYADGSEELYDSQHDPNEWENLAGKAEHQARLKELARHIPAASSVKPTVDKSKKGKTKKSKQTR